MADSLCSLADRVPGRLGFFEEFQELSARSRFASTELPPSRVEMSNPVCGDEVMLAVGVVDGKVQGFAYQQNGCWPVSGCLELLGLLVEGAPLDQVLSFGLEDFLALVDGVPAGKRHAFSLTHRALRSALCEAVGSRSVRE